jgi:hypothetical protein
LNLAAPFRIGDHGKINAQSASRLSCWSLAQRSAIPDRQEARVARM